MGDCCWIPTGGGVGVNRIEYIEYYVPAISMTPAHENGAAPEVLDFSANSGLTIDVMDFIHTNTRTAFFLCPFNQFVDYSVDPKYYIYWTGSGATGQDVCAYFKMSARAISVSQSLDFAVGGWGAGTGALYEQRDSDNLWGGDDTDVSPFLKAKSVAIQNTPIDRDMIAWKFDRIPGTAGDDFDYTASVIGIHIQFKVLTSVLTAWQTI